MYDGRFSVTKTHWENGKLQTIKLSSNVQLRGENYYQDEGVLKEEPIVKLDHKIVR